MYSEGIRFIKGVRARCSPVRWTRRDPDAVFSSVQAERRGGSPAATPWAGYRVPQCRALGARPGWELQAPVSRAPRAGRGAPREWQEHRAEVLERTPALACLCSGSVHATGDTQKSGQPGGGKSTRETVAITQETTTRTCSPTREPGPDTTIERDRFFTWSSGKHDVARNYRRPRNERKGSRRGAGTRGPLQVLWALPGSRVRTFVKTLHPSTTTAALHCAKVAHREVAFQDVAEGTGAVAGSESALDSRVSAIHREGCPTGAAHRREAAGPLGALAMGDPIWGHQTKGSSRVCSDLDSQGSRLQTGELSHLPPPHAKKHLQQGALTPCQAKSISHSGRCSTLWRTKASTEGPIGLRLNTRHTRILKLNDIICQNSSFLT